MTLSFQSTVSSFVNNAECDMIRAAMLNSSGDAAGSLEASRRAHAAHERACQVVAVWLRSLPSIETECGDLFVGDLSAVRAVESRLDTLRLHLDALDGLDSAPVALAAE